MSRRLAAVAVAAAAFVSLPACSGTTTAAAPSPPTTADANLGATVVLKNIAFNPATVTIRAHQDVTWLFEDGSIPHNVTGDTWRSTERTSGSFTHTFDTPGTYRYQCTIHSGMTGTVIVTP